MMSFARTALLMAAMTGLFLMFGFLLGGETGMALAFVVAAGMNIFAYWNSDKLVLKMHGARAVDHRTAPELVNLVENLASRAQIPTPAVYILDSDQPNAFATGRNPENAAVAASAGLLRRLNRQEIEAVMAHELAHIINRDTLIMTITATLAGAISMLANFALFFGGNRNNPLGIIGTILMMILAPLAAMLVQMAISRTREYAADKTGAEICGNPLALATALSKIQRGAEITENVRAEANPATAHLFIANPLHGRSLDNLFSTHPRMEERIKRLEAMTSTLAARPLSRPTNSRATQNNGTKASTGRSRSGGSSVPDSGQRRKGPWG